MNVACEVEPTHTSDAAVGLTEGPFVPHASEPPGVTALHGADHAARQFARSRREAASRGRCAGGIRWAWCESSASVQGESNCCPLTDEESFQEEILETDSVVRFDHYCLHACMEVLA